MNIVKKAVVFYLLTQLFTFVLGGIQQFTKTDPSIILLPQLGPGLAAVTTLLIYRKDHVKLTASIKADQILKYLAAIAIPVLVSLVLFFIGQQFIGNLGVPHLGVTSFPVLLGGILVGAFGEELGWRGYLQQILESRANILVASLWVGVLWGMWHFGNYHYGAIWMLFFLCSTTAYSVIMAWLLRNANYNVLIAGLFHSAVNLGFFLLKDALADLRFIMLNGVVWMSIAIILVCTRRKVFLQNPAGNEL